MDMQKVFDRFMDDYQTIKNYVKIHDPQEFERWKVGGFIVDEDIVSMYSNITEAFEKVFDNDPENYDEDE